MKVTTPQSLEYNILESHSVRVCSHVLGKLILYNFRLHNLSSASDLSKFSTSGIYKSLRFLNDHFSLSVITGFFENKHSNPVRDCIYY